ncbi:MAG: hypothetical protein IIA40_03700 [SAR324 cluster bacterium]|nr:hypothetical protein [SAR324 cluster bacterium]
MIVCRGSTKNGTRVRRYSSTVRLEASLVELLTLCERTGAPGPAVTRLIGGEIERCLGDAGQGRERLHAHVQSLMRARDLHQYVLEDADLIALKMRLLEHLLFHRTAFERWAAIRDLLLTHIDTICQTPLPGLSANMELYKGALSDRSSRLGKLLVAVALFNFDLDEEAPPDNMMIHFRRGGFPQYSWEICTGNARTTHFATAESWSPANPYCRWEYLGADLAHGLLRRSQPPRARPAEDLTDRTPPAAEQATGELQTLFCRFEGNGAPGGGAQLDLLPFEVGAFIPELLRLIHRRHGPQGVQLLALLLALFDDAAPGAVLELELAEVAADAALNDPSAQGQRLRVRRLERLIEQLAGIELTRLSGKGAHRRADTSRLVTVLGRSGDWHAEADGTDNRDAARSGRARRSSPAARLRLMLDPLLHGASSHGAIIQGANGGGLGTVFRGLPEIVREFAGKEHPFLLPLYVYLRGAWATTTGSHRPAIERTAQQLFHEAGIWVSETGRYRALETLRRELETLREHGFLGAWRMQRSPVRDAMEDRYRLLAPEPGGRQGQARSGREHTGSDWKTRRDASLQMG